MNLYRNLNKKLIELFFHPKSYFLFCISRYLDSLLKNQIHSDKTYLIKHLVNRLINADSTSNELKNISKLTGFQNIDIHLEQHVSQFDFTNSDQKKKKRSIASISNSFIKNLLSILQNEKAWHCLVTYLGLNDSWSQKENPIPVVTALSSSQEKVSPNDTDLLEQFFEEEISNLLKLIDKYNEYKLTEVDPGNLFRDWKKSFQQIKNVSLMQGYDKIEAVADRILRITNFHQASQIKPDEATLKILLDGKDLIEKMVLKKEQLDNFAAVLNNLDEYLHNLEEKLLVEGNKISTESKSTKESQPEEKYDDNSQRRKFTIPGENDPELLSLIKEINQSVSSDKKDISTKNTIILNNNQKTVAIENESIADDDRIGVKLLNKETALYFKLINSALNELSIDNRSESALEDLELASSSLKSHAMKFGFEKLSKLPQIIEEIATLLINRELEMPEDILHSIKETILLLQTYKDTNSCHDKFRNIYYDLNRYRDKLTMKHKVIQF